MNEKICCFTGHREIPQSEIPAMKKRLLDEIVNLIQQDVTHFRAGGALGFDTLAALAVLKLKKIYPHIYLDLILPCKDQSSRWNSDDVLRYQRILSRADSVVFTSEHYFSGCMQKRNRCLVDGSQYCICFFAERTGGTAYTVAYAKNKGTKIIRV